MPFVTHHINGEIIVAQSTFSGIECALFATPIYS
jgi:hypothetical protein